MLYHHFFLRRLPFISPAKSSLVIAALLGALTAPLAQADDPLLAPLASSAPTTELSSTQQARGVLRAIAQATLSSDLAGRIIELPFREGQSFKQGDLLARFDCSVYQAQLNASQASARAAQAELNQNQQLAQMKSVGKYAVSLSAAKLAQAQAESQVYQIQVSRCRLLAPFDGQIVSRKVNAFESVTQGTPMMEVVDNRHLEIDLLVPSRWLTRIQPGMTFTFTPDETGQPLQARVARLGARIDEGSQTLSLIGTIDNKSSAGDNKSSAGKDNHLIAGMSGTAQFTEAQ